MQLQAPTSFCIPERILPSVRYRTLKAALGGLPERGSLSESPTQTAQAASASSSWPVSPCAPRTALRSAEVPILLERRYG